MLGLEDDSAAWLCARDGGGPVGGGGIAGFLGAPGILMVNVGLRCFLMFFSDVVVEIWEHVSLSQLELADNSGSEVSRELICGPSSILVIMLKACDWRPGAGISLSLRLVVDAVGCVCESGCVYE